MIKYNLNNINDWYHDDADIIKVYYNGNVVYHKVAVDYENNYLTLRILSGGTVVLPADLFYSTDNGETWTETTVNDRTINASAGDAILLKGETVIYSYLVSTSSTAYYDVEGNIMSTQYGDGFKGQTVLKNYVTGAFKQTHVVNADNLKLPATALVINAYNEMFYHCTDLISVPELPATTLADYCYQGMFEGCTSLVTAPELPATTLGTGSYHTMFKGCTGLTVAPDLPATTVTPHAYSMMFESCSSLATAPVISATSVSSDSFYGMFADCTSLTDSPVLLPATLATESYYMMFNGCTSLTAITCLATDKSATRCTQDWVVGVASSGTFYKAKNATWSNGNNGVPYNWTIKNHGEIPYSGQYLTIESLEDGNSISFSQNSIDYSLNKGQTWSTLATGNSISLDSGDTAMFKATGLSPSVLNGIGTFSTTKTYNVYGNVMSLTAGDNFATATTMSNYQFLSLFKGSKVVSAENLILSATLSSECYRYMFQNCTSLTSAPELPATSLANSCYNSMFYGCRSLTTAPELPATTLASQCYYWMFFGCSSLNYVKSLATDISANSCTVNWLNGVSATGTFVKARLMQSEWQCGASGIPDGWSVEDEYGNPETNPCD